MPGLSFALDSAGLRPSYHRTMQHLAIMLALFASILSGRYLVSGLRTGKVATFSQLPLGWISRKQRPGWYWATVAIWLVGMLVGAFFAVTWMREIVAH